MSGSIGKFQSDEPFVELFYDQQADFSANAKKISGAKVVVVQSTAEPVAEHVLHLLEMVHTLKRYGATEVMAVVPFAAFSRQDRPFGQRFASVAADLFARQLKAAGADKVISFTMHSQGAIKFYEQAFGSGFTALSATDVFGGYLKNKFFLNSSDLVVGAPDGAEKPGDEGQKRAKDLSMFLTGTFNAKAMFRISKVHTATSETKITSFDGDVADKDCVIVDDMVDGGSTMINAAKLLKAKGARSVTCCFTHAILTKGIATALEKIMTAQESGVHAIDNLVMTDAIPEAADKIEDFARQYPALAKKITVIPLGHAILAEVKRQMAVVPANENAPAKPADRKLA